MDTAVVIDGVVSMLLVGTPKDSIDVNHYPGAVLVEVASGTSAPGMTWNGTAIVAPVVPVPVPYEVALWQARSATKAAGLFDAIDAYVEAHKIDNPILWEAWNMGNTVSRRGVFVTSIGPQLGLTDIQIDDLFRAAADIRG